MTDLMRAVEIMREKWLDAVQNEMTTISQMMRGQHLSRDDYLRFNAKTSVLTDQLSIVKQLDLSAIVASVAAESEQQWQGEYPIDQLMSDQRPTMSEQQEPNLLAEMDYCIERGSCGNRTRDCLRAAREALANQHPTIPPDWKLVPIEPTDKMIGHGYCELDVESFTDPKAVYRAMIAAAPERKEG